MKCGVGDYTASLAQALMKCPNTDVAVITTVGAGVDISKSNLEIFPIIRDWKLREFSQVVKIVKQWKPDIAHIQYPTHGYRRGRLPYHLPPMLLFLGVKIVQTWHEYYTRESVHWAMIPRVIAAHGIVAVRPNFKERMPVLYRWLIRHKEFRFIPNASAIPRVVIDDVERTVIQKQFTSARKSLLVFLDSHILTKGLNIFLKLPIPQSITLF